MMRAFIDNAGGGDRPSDRSPLPRFSDDSEPLHVMLVGSAAVITSTIHNLHQRGFAEVSAWSPLVPWGPGQMVSLLTKRLPVES